MSSAGLFPHTPDVDRDRPGAETRTLTEAGDLISVLTSTTARAILEALYAAPGPASDVADRLGLTIQTASYHLARLTEAGLLDVVGTWYSSKGAEMAVYAPAKDPLVLVAGRPADVRRVARVLADDAPGDPDADASGTVAAEGR